MQVETLLGAAGLGVIIGVVQLAKNLGVTDRFAPALALALGVLLLVGYRLQYGESAGLWFDLIFQGLVLGLGASGLYSGLQTTRHGATVLREKEVENYDILVAPKGSVQATIEQVQSPSEQEPEEDL